MSDDKAPEEATEPNGTQQSIDEDEKKDKPVDVPGRRRTSRTKARRDRTSSE